MNQIKPYIIFALIFVSCTQTSEIDQKEKRLKELQDQKREIDKEIRLLVNDLEQKGVKKNLPLVEIQTLLKANFVKMISVNGSIEALNHAKLSCEVAAKLVDIHVSKGQRVKKGHLVASLNSEAIDNSLKELQTSLNLARTVFSKQERLWAQEVGSEIQYLEAKLNKETLEKKLEVLRSQKDLYFIKASFDGIIDEVYAKIGETIIPGMPLVDLLDLDRVNAVVDVSEKYISFINKGNPVGVKFPSLENDYRQSNVSRVSNVINKKNRTFKAEILLNNKSLSLKPNMMCVVSFEERKKSDVICLPNNCLQKDMKGFYVYKASSIEGLFRAKKIYVSTGLSNNKQTVISEGVEEGELIITKGYNQISDGMEVEVYQ